jgi:hypothetical protein
MSDNDPVTPPAAGEPRKWEVSVEFVCTGELIVEARDEAEARRLVRELEGNAYVKMGPLFPPEGIDADEFDAGAIVEVLSVSPLPPVAAKQKEGVS